MNLTKDLTPGRRLNRGDSLFSSLAGFRLILQDDGDLTLYDLGDVPVDSEVPALLSHRPEVMKFYTNLIWTAGTNVGAAAQGAGTLSVSCTPTAILSSTTRRVASVANRVRAGTRARFSDARMTATW